MAIVHILRVANGLSFWNHCGVLLYVGALRIVMRCDAFIGETKNGCWIGARATLLGNIVLKDSSVVAACALVNHDVPQNAVVGGVPAKIIRRLDNEDAKSSEE